MEERRRCWLLLKPACLIMHYRISVNTIAKASDGRQHGHGLPQSAHHGWQLAGCSKACGCALLACCGCFGQRSASTLHKCISTAEFSEHGMSASKPRKLQNLKTLWQKNLESCKPYKKTLKTNRGTKARVIGGRTDGRSRCDDFLWSCHCISLKSCRKFPSIVGGHFLNWNFLLSKGSRNFILEAASAIPWWDLLSYFEWVLSFQDGSFFHILSGFIHSTTESSSVFWMGSFILGVGPSIGS